MPAIARVLVRDPKITLLDEPFEGLAPIIVRDVLATCRGLAEAGQTILSSSRTSRRQPASPTPPISSTTATSSRS